jgi:hypothetical protein
VERATEGLASAAPVVDGALAGDDLGALFGIELAAEPPVAVAAKRRRRRSG